MKTKNYILFLFVFILFQSCKAQQTTISKVENNLKGDLDYTVEALDLVQRQANGDEISLGKINQDGTVHFNLPEFDIKALYDSIPLQHYVFQQLFNIDSSCKDRDVFAETPFDDVYVEKYKLLVKKYGMNVAILEPTSENQVGKSEYYWLYMDRAIAFKDDCVKISYQTNAIYESVSADIQFEKGWNFIEENVEIVQNPSKIDSLTTQSRKVHFTKISPSNKKVKWFLRQIEEEEKIQTAKRLHNLTPITKNEFEKWTPNKLGDLSITIKEYGTLPERRKNKNNIHLTYTNETQKKEIDLYVIDCAKNPGAIEMANFSYAMDNRGKEKKDIKPYIAQFSERKKATQFMYKVDDRMLVEASSATISGEALWEYIKKLNVEKLLK